ncbi:hypothetical protein Tsubulata_009079 [Turnera subulata]|uniref:CCHC-type domain-containing protein n=1 Tax=Turnera subulata TaxID=218843 RepID=A0A9Q0JH11_9ROSI|nr:hypothetical protein Tsubulata_009079 [Turnera subulata]
MSEPRERELTPSMTKERVRERSPARRDPNPNLASVLFGSLAQSSRNPGMAATQKEEKSVEDGGGDRKKVRLKEPMDHPPTMPMETELNPEATEEPPFPDPPVMDTIMEDSRSSYLETLTGRTTGQQTPDPWEEEEEAEFEDGDIEVVERDGKKVVELSQTFLSRLRKPWEKAVVVKLLGRAIGFKTLQMKLYTLWKPKGPMKIIDLENNYFVVVTWVRFLDFPLDHYHSRILRTLGNLVGKAVKLEQNSDNPSRGKFAKVVVAVDLTQPLEGTVTVENESYKVVYEGPPDICGNCGRIGHLSVSCLENDQASYSEASANDSSAGHTNPNIPDISNPPDSPSGVPQTRQTPGTPNAARGEWMNAPRRSRRPPKRQADGIPLPQGNPRGQSYGNRFQALFEEPTEKEPEQYQATSTTNSQHIPPVPTPRIARNPPHQTPPQKPTKPPSSSIKRSGQASSSKHPRTPLNNITNKTTLAPNQATTGTKPPPTQPKVILRHNPEATLTPRPLSDIPLPSKTKHSAVKLSEANHKDIISTKGTEPTPTPYILPHHMLQQAKLPPHSLILKNHLTPCAPHP